MGKSSQRKGRSGEAELTRILQEFGYPVQIGLPVNHGTTPDIIGLPYAHSEVKRVEKLNVVEAMKQALRDSIKFHDGFPVLFHRRNREKWLVTMYLDDWLEVYDRFLEVKNKEEFGG